MTTMATKATTQRLGGDCHDSDDEEEEEEEKRSMCARRA